MYENMPWVMAGGIVLLTSILAIREYEKQMKAPVRLGRNHYMAREHFDRLTRAKTRRSTRKNSPKEGVVDLTSKNWGGR